MQEIADYSLMFPLQVENLYNFTGDKTFLEEMLPVAEGVVEYFAKYEREDGLIYNANEKWNLVDWPENLRDGYDFPLKFPVGDGCHSVINAYYYGAKACCNRLRGYLGQEEKYCLEPLKKSFRNVFYSEENGLFVDGENSRHSALHPNALALFFGLAQKDEAKNISEFIVKKGLNCGVFFSYFVLKGLVKYGYHNEMMTLLLNRSEHSWINMLREGATSCFEAWGKEQKWNTSLCHPWGSAPILLITEDVLGIQFSEGKRVQKDIKIPHNMTMSLQMG